MNNIFWYGADTLWVINDCVCKELKNWCALFSKREIHCVCIWSFLPPMDWIIHFLLLRKINKIGHENSIASAIGYDDEWRNIHSYIKQFQHQSNKCQENWSMVQYISYKHQKHLTRHLIFYISAHTHNLYIIRIKCMNKESCNVNNWIPQLLTQHVDN